MRDWGDCDSDSSDTEGMEPDAMGEIFSIIRDIDFTLDEPEESISSGSLIIQATNPCLSAVLAKTSLHLERLSASFLADAKDFFHAYQPDWIWKNLVSLALTSRLLDLLCGPSWH